MTSTTHAPITVVGGGVAGLTAAALLGHAGVPVVLLEKAAAPGGRAITGNRHGFSFNLGPHALYRDGVLHHTLKSLGVAVRGSVPNGNGGYALLGGRRHTLPTGLASLLTTGLLPFSGKFELARFQARLGRFDSAAAQRDTLRSWLDSNVSEPMVQQLVMMLTRVTTFTHDPDHQSAGAALEQLQLAVRGNVLYLDGGWQTIVDALRDAAVASGVRIVADAHAAALERDSDRQVDAVRLADGRVIRTSGVIIATAPSDVDGLAGTQLAAALPPPIRMATLDVALRSLPNPRATVAFGVDAPVYFSVHSAVAKLAPQGGAMIHVSKYLRPGETAGRGDEIELETLMDTLQPDWRDQLVLQRFLPSLTVAHAEVTAAQGGVAGRPPTPVPAFDNVWIAGDWVGAKGQLSDAAAASATDAVHSILAAVTPIAVSDTPALVTHRPAVRAAS
ncbi:MAG: FAD-dependent oxidoreductase [Acidobacteriota bacterium]